MASAPQSPSTPATRPAPVARRGTVVERALAARHKHPSEPGTYALFIFEGLGGMAAQAHKVSSREVKHLSIPSRTFGFCFADAGGVGWQRPSHMYFVDGDVWERQSLHLILGDRAGEVLRHHPDAERFFRPQAGGLFPMEPDDVALPVERIVTL